MVIKWITNVWLEPGGEVVRDPGLYEDSGQEPRWYHQEEEEGPGRVRGQQVKFLYFVFYFKKVDFCTCFFLFKESCFFMKADFCALFLFQEYGFLYFVFYFKKTVFLLLLEIFVIKS